jgi:DNA repair exonuclease SbcCD ATPase subunit
MRHLKFEYAAARNFLPFGPKGIELHFNKYGNIILVRGENRDAKPIDASLPSEECKISSNGTGKSSLQEIIVWTLFGKTCKRPEKLSKDDVVHNLVGKDCRCEVIFDKYRIVRTRKEGGNPKKNSLRLWESETHAWDDSLDKDPTEKTQGTMDATQKKIESIIGLSYEAFINICVFTDDQRLCFLECDGTKKREIVENMLSLADCRQWCENAKQLRKEAKSTIDTKAKEYAILLGNKDDAERRLQLTQKKQQDWRKAKLEEKAALQKRAEAKVKELQTTDTGAALLAYQQAQATIKKLNEAIPAKETALEEMRKKIDFAKDKETELRDEAQKLSKEYEEYARKTKLQLEEKKKKEAEIADLRSAQPGTRCNKCRSVVEAENIENYVVGVEQEIELIVREVNLNVTKAKELAAKVEELKQRQAKVKTLIGQGVSKMTAAEDELRTLRQDLVDASQVREPKADSAEFLIQQQIEELQRQVTQKENELEGPSPFQDILENDKVELKRITTSVEEKDREVKSLEAKLPYYDYWLTGFGEHGIRKWVVDGIIPQLNSRINYWLQFLIDNKITLKFDNELEECIERNPVDGDPYVYHAMSTGQRRRLNLAVSQSFAHVMENSAGAVPSIIFLDEVSTNVDPLGVQGIYNMISELAEDKQVFVTTHDPDLLRMLQGADVIRLEHRDGFTEMLPN